MSLNSPIHFSVFTSVVCGLHLWESGPCYEKTMANWATTVYSRNNDIVVLLGLCCFPLKNGDLESKTDAESGLSPSVMLPGDPAPLVSCLPSPITVPPELLSSPISLFDPESAVLVGDGDEPMTAPPPPDPTTGGGEPPRLLHSNDCCLCC